MTSALSCQNSISLCPASFCTLKAKFACYSRYFLTSYFCIPVPYNEKDIFSGCSLEGLKLKLKLQYFGHLMGRVDSFEKTLMLGKIEGRRRRGGQRMR